MKRVFTLLLFLMAGTAMFGQVTLKPGVGLNWTDFSKNQETGEYQARVGWHLGGTVIFGSKFYGEAGAFWVQKSTNFVDENSTGGDIESKMSGIRIPAGIGLDLLGSEESTFNIHIMGGASAFILTKFESGGMDIKDDANSVQWGLYAGAGLDIWLIFIDLSYEWSLTDIQKDVTQIDVGKTRGLYATAGIRIPLGQ